MAEDTLFKIEANELSIYGANYADKWIVTYEGGFGMPPVRHISDKGAFQHGETWKDFRLLPRIIDLNLRYVGSSRSGLYHAQETLSTWLGAFGKFKLQKVRPDGAVREIVCNFLDGMSFPKNSKDNESAQVDTLKLRADDPIWYDPTQKVFYVVGGANSGTWLYGVAAGLIFPATFGSMTLGVTETLQYAGTFRTYPVIYLTGPLEDLIITNLTTDEKISFDGYHIAAGETVEVDCRYGYKTVMKTSVTPNTSLLDKLTTDSDLGTFHLAAREAGEMTHTNEIKLEGGGATGASKIIMRYYERFLTV